jgi:6-phosphofructokinase 1
LFPEVVWDEAKFLAKVQDTVKKIGYCVVVVSEGLKDVGGKFLAEEGGQKDSFGHSQLGGVGPKIAGIVKDKLNLKVHWAVPDYLQRSARHLASKTDLEQAMAVGAAAVGYAMDGLNGVMPVIKRLSHSPYKWRIEPVALEKIANHEKKMPANFIRKDGYGITAACRQYLEPLIQGEAPPPYAKNGLPRYFVD